MRMRNERCNPATGALAATIAAASLLHAACATDQSERLAASDARSATLAGTRWSLQTLGAEKMPGTPAITLNFDTGSQLSGSDGCNRYQGSYTISGSTISIGRNLAGTLIACSDSVEAQARAYREALERVMGFVRADDGLHLQDSAGSPLASFTPAIVSPAGANWEVVSYSNGKQSVVSVMLGTRITADFGGDGRVTGTAGCNRYFASYEVDGQTLSVGPAGAGRRVCAEPEGVMRQEAMYLEALHSAATFRIDGERLELRGASGALAVVLKRSAG